MKIYAIYDKESEQNLAIGYLFYYEKAEAYVIELAEWLDEWEAPLLFQGLVKKGIYTVPASLAVLWVRERVIPSGRQNIGSILKNAKLKEYNEMALLELSKGMCAQDSCYIEAILREQLPEDIKERTQKNISECFLAEDRQLICLFYDNTVRKLDLSKMADHDRDVCHILKNEALLESAKVGVGGYCITFNDSIEIAASAVRKEGVLLPVSANDMLGFVQKNLVDTTTACDMLQCSRQNISYLIKTKKLLPVMRGAKENLFTKGAVEKVRNE